MSSFVSGGTILERELIVSSVVDNQLLRRYSTDLEWCHTTILLPGINGKWSWHT